MKLPVVDSDSSESGLEKDGWKREFVTSEPRLSEVCGLFKSLGREVKIMPTVEEIGDLDGTCKACFESTREVTFTIWTRK